MAASSRVSPFKVLGAIVALASLVLVVAPTLVHTPAPTTDLFEATERHVRWGLGISIGGAFIVHPWRRPWSVLIAWIVFSFSAGYLVARFVGIAIEGPSNLKQWGLVGVEVIICGIAALWIRHRRNAPDRE